MKGYYVGYGYYGHVGKDEYVLFATEDEYTEWYNENMR